MEIYTKLQPGDKLFALRNNKVQDFMVESVTAVSTFNYNTNKPYDGISISYRLRVGLSAGSRAEIDEGDIGKTHFLSKEDLIKSL